MTVYSNTQTTSSRISDVIPTDKYTNVDRMVTDQSIIVYVILYIRNME